MASSTTRTIDVGGKTVLPGIIDSHIHVESVGENLNRVRTNDLTSIAQLLDRIKAAAAKARDGEWIEGASDWHESQLKENRFPTRWELDEVAPDNPVFMRRGGHNVVINTQAMLLAKIGEKDPDPPGGHYRRDDQERLTGWILERPAIEPIAKLIPKSTPEEAEMALERAMAALSSSGITAVRGQHVSPQELGSWRALAKAGATTVRGVLIISINPRRPAKLDFDMLQKLELKQDQGDDMVRIGGLKLTHDGGVETSLLTEEFANRKGYKGIQVTPLAKVKEVSEFACANGWRMSVHTVGDQAIKNVLGVWDTLNKTCPLSTRMWGLEHPYLPDSDDIALMKTLGIVPYMQTSHNYTLGVGWVEFWGKARADKSIPNRTLIDAGLKPAGGTDAPVTPFNPFIAMWGDVTRGTVAAGVLGKDQAVTPLESLRMHTIWSARGLMMDDRIGSIEIGKYADLAVVSDDVLAIDPEKLKDVQAEMTILSGKVVYQR
jgi:hypothetical protein